MPISPLSPATLPLRAVAPASVSQAAAAPPGTPDSIQGDDAPLLTPQALAEALQLTATGAPVALTPAVEANLVEVLDGTDRVLGDVIHALNETLDAAPAGEAHEAREMIAVAECIAEGIVPSTTPGTPAHALSLDLQDALQAAEADNGAPLTVAERLQVLIQSLGRTVQAIVRNDEGNGPGLRLLANALHSTARTGLIVTTATLIRQLVGYGTERVLQLHQVDDSARAMLGSAALLLGPVLVLAGGIREHLNHTDTAMSLASRLTMIATTGGAFALLAATGALPQMASFGGQVLSYTIARDGLQLFFPMHDNSRIDMQSTLFGGLVWAGLQYAVDLANGVLALGSGAGHAMSHAMHQAMANCTELATAGSTLPPADYESMLHNVVCSFGDVLAAAAGTAAASAYRGLINAVPEVVDDHVRQHASLRDAEEGLRLNAGARIPTRANVLDTLLTTHAGRSTIFNNIVGLSLGVEAAIGHLLPTGSTGAHARAAITFGLCFWAYWPLIQMHERAPASEAGRVEAPPDPRQPESTGVRRRVPESAV